MKKLSLGIFLGLLTPFVVGYIFLISGGMPVATQGPPLPFERFIAKTALHAAFRAEQNKLSPLPPDEKNLLAGAQVYLKNCAECHGLEHGALSAVAKGLFPEPPQLLESDHGVTDDPIGETYWKVRNGIRLTGMPGFVQSLTDTEIWQVSQVLVHADQLPSSVHEALRAKK